MPENNVSIEKLWDKLDRVETRIGDRVDAVGKDVLSLALDMREAQVELKKNSSALIDHAQAIETLKDRDRGVMAIASALGGLIGAATAAAFKIFGGQQ